MIDIKIGERKLKLCTEWHDVTFGQLILLYQLREKWENDLAMMMTIISSQTNEVLGDHETEGSLYWHWSHCDFKGFVSQIIPLTQFCFETFNWEGIEVPESIEVDGKTIKIPVDLSMCSFGQKVIAGQTLKNFKGRIANDVLAEIVAIYLQPIIDDKKFDTDRVDEIKVKILSQPAIKIYPIAAFFLTQLENLAKEYNDKCCSPLTNEQRRADPSGLNKFGDFATIHRLAQGNVLNYEPVLNITYREILTTLALETQQLLYLNRYNEIIRKKITPEQKRKR